MANKRDLKIRSHTAHGRKKRSAPAPSKPAAASVPQEPALSYAEAPASDTQEPVREVARPRRKRRSLVKVVLTRTLVVAVVVAVGFLVWKNWENLAPDSLLIWIDEKLAGSPSGDGFPVPVAGSAVTAFRELEGNLVLVNDTALTMINSKGGEAVRRPHSYSTPLLETAGKYALLAEGEGTRFRLETRAKTVLEKEAAYPIVSAGVNAKGTIALVTDASQSYSTEIVVYDRGGKELYRRSRKLQAVDIAVSPEGDRVAVISVAASQGALKSYLEIFTFGKETDPVFSHEELDTLFAGVDYLADGRLAVIGSDSLWIVDPTTSEVNREEYGGASLLGYAVHEKGAAVALQPSGVAEGGQVLVAGGKEQEPYTVSFTGGFRHLAACSQGFLLLTSDQVQVLEMKQAGGALAVPPDGRMVGALGKRIMVLGLTTLTEYDWPAAS